MKNGDRAVDVVAQTGPRDQQSTADPLTVVGIGASAGGIGPLREFFQEIPEDSGMAFVVVIHLSPEHESSLAEVLQSSASIPFQQVHEKVQIHPDCGYVIPPGKDLTIEDGYLNVSDVSQQRAPRTSVDTFFRTLARSHHECIGIIFSGTGTDGTVGSKDIKEAGGLLLVQSPEDAAHDSMPRSAINLGLVDFALPARKLARKVIELRAASKRIRLPARPDQLAEKEAEATKGILAEILGSTGHDFSGYKRSTVLRRFERRMRVNQVEDLPAYLSYLQGNAQETQALAKDLLISVTNFFRDAAAYEFLSREIIPDLFEGRTSEDEIKIWAPGCATGEEAYSLGMLMLEHASSAQTRPRIQIFGSDPDEGALAAARDGIYPDSIKTDVSDERLRRFFVREGTSYRAKPELREIVLFASHNLLRDPPFSKLDLISCRNVLIYLQRNLQAKVSELFHYALKPEGYLFLGSSESADTHVDMFQTISKKHRVYRRLGGTGRLDRLPQLPLSLSEPKRRVQLRTDRAGRSTDTSPIGLHIQMLESHAPPSAIINENYELIHISDSAGRYFQHPGGAPTTDIIKLVRKELRLPLRAAVHRAFEKSDSATTGPVSVQVDGRPRIVYLVVRPSRGSDSPPTAMVVFVEAEYRAQTAESDRESTVIQELEKELDWTRASLQTTVEEYDTSREEMTTANEELLSTNEEYKSTLEELETSKEELQSVNEELQTVNSELNSKVEELSRSNDDLSNLMSSTVATLFVDKALCIKMYTPQMESLFNLMPGDIGRPLAHLAHNHDYTNLVSDARIVLEKLSPIEREARTADRRRFLTRLLPYRTSDDRIEGVVITFFDITRLKHIEEDLRQSEERFRLLVSNVREYAILFMDENGMISGWSTGAERIFGYTEQEVLGQSASIISSPEDRETGRDVQELDTAREKGQSLDEKWHIRKDGSRFWGTGVLSALYNGNGVLRGFVKILRDNSRQRRDAEIIRERNERLKELNQTLEDRIAERTAELKDRNTQINELASELVMAEQRERHRIAQFLHDDLQQTLYGIQIKATTLAKKFPPQGGEAFSEQAQEISEYLDQVIKKTRQLAIDLSPPILKDEGLKEALQWLAMQMEELYELHISITTEEELPEISEEMRLFLFQTTRELLFNTVKHADVHEADVKLTCSDETYTIEVSDRGRGFDTTGIPEERGENESFGLSHVKGRLSLFNGTMNIESTPGTGTRVTVSVPRVLTIRQRNG